MATLNEFFGTIWESFVTQVSDITFTDVLDIAIVSVILYYVFRFIRNRRAGKLAVGVVLLVLFEALSTLLELATVQFILENVLQVGLIALIVLFQPELRSMLESMGGESIKSLKSIREQKDTQQTLNMIDGVCEAVQGLSETATGALIVIERETKLGDVIMSGTVVNADTSPFLIKNIFFKNSPLHDGAMIIRDGRVYAAGCLLPLSQNADIIRDLGTRHRAAIGMSENSDALVIVVSEETGTISVAQGGLLKRGYDSATLKWELEELLLEAHAPKRLLPWKRREGERDDDDRSDKGGNDKGGSDNKDSDDDRKVENGKANGGKNAGNKKSKRNSVSGSENGRMGEQREAHKGEK